MKDCGRTTADEPITTFGIATWNVQSCRRGLSQVAWQLGTLGVDIVALQEVDRGTRRSGHVDQTAQLAREAGFPYHEFFPATGRDRGEYGLALLSRHPIEQPRVVRLPVLAGTESRVLGCAVVHVPGGPLSVYVTHLSHRPSEGIARRWQVRTIHEVLHADPRPKILAGDFNDVPRSATHRALTRHLVDVFDAAGEGEPGTFPLPFGWMGMLRLDYLFASREVRPLVARVVPTAASDHHVLTATIACPISAVALASG